MKSEDKEFELLLFATNPIVIRSAAEAGVNGFIVDMENKGKQSRQAGFDTQINQNTIEDLIITRKNTDRKVICRINGFSDHTPLEVEQVVQAGADEILLPMVRKPEEVLKTLDFINSRCALGILVETTDAVLIAALLGSLPLSRIYVGLNDLAIDRKLPNIFMSVADGTVEKIRMNIYQPFGFGGVTLPDRGEPIPCRLLMGELARLNCDFTFLRRSFFRDMVGRDMQVEIPRIKEALKACSMRTDEQISNDNAEFIGYVNGNKRLGACI